MGLLVDGEWRDAWYDTKQTGGRFVRKDSTFRGVASLAEVGRYRLYVSLACPWAHRVLIVRALKGLEEALPVSIVDPFMGDHGWGFSDGPGCVPDPVFGARYLSEIYVRADPRYTGRVTVPVLFDTRTQTIVNNESAEILRILNRARPPTATRACADLYPENERAEIDAVNALTYDAVNNGVYKAGFATTQSAYEEAVTALFAALDALDARLSGQRFLLGAELTEADIRLFTLVRFDAVYHGHFRCNLRRLVDYEHLWRYARAIYAIPHVAETVNFEHIKQHYYRSHTSINPTGIVPLGPIVRWDESPPPALLRAADLLAAGEWQAAHLIVQDDPSPLAAWMHGIVHLLEGDSSNARYWYGQAGRPFPSGADVPAEIEAARAKARALP